MRLKVSSAKPGLSPDDVNEAEEKEVGDYDDDDRNHKHHRQEAHSQSLVRDTLGPVLSKPYRKRNKPFEYGNHYKRDDSWQSYHTGNSGPGRGRGREPGLGGQCGTTFGSAEVAPRLVQHGSRLSSLFAGRGVPNDAQSTPWNTFGVISTPSNGGGLNSLYPLGLRPSLGQSINSAMNMGIIRPRCRDFEERGFCLKGNICPMEHGINHIVVEDVQSLSQFNLPVSLPSAHLQGVSTGQGPLPAVKSRIPGVNDDGIGFNGSVTAGADGYDPDQPIWGNDCRETSSAFLPQTQTTVDKTESLLDMAAFDCHHLGLSDGFDSEHRLKKVEPTLTNAHGARQGKHTNTNNIGQQVTEFPPRPKALRTLFVNGIPQKDNKKEALLLHFQKFGEVIEIYNPFNSERAFVQFSKREEAEAALKSPDAVMGNRFIKLWWANRDKQSSGVTKNIALNSVYTDHPKPVVATGPKLPIFSQKKRENLELLKEQIRKKQEMLDKKRIEFRRQLDRLEKQATGLKDEQVLDPASKRRKVNKSGTAKTLESTGPSSVPVPPPPPQAEGMAEHGPKSCSNVVMRESLTLIPSVCPLVPLGEPSKMDRFEVDNIPIPTSFKIIPPLPSGLANVTLLKQHLSTYGDLSLSTVELERSDKTCHERAFVDDGNCCWQRTSTNSSPSHFPSPRQLSRTNVQLYREAAATAPAPEKEKEDEVLGNMAEERDSDHPGDLGLGSTSI